MCEAPVRAVSAGAVPLMLSTLLEEAGFVAAFSGREGGHSAYPYASLNLGVLTGDDRPTVLANRRQLAQALGIDRFALGRQVHAATVTEVGPGEIGAGFDDPDTTLPATDALTTTIPGVGLAVLTADCVPVVLAEPSTGRVATVHAGWKGIVAGVVEDTVARFERPAGILAAIGPAIGPDHYEVGGDVAVAVASRAGEDVVDRTIGANPHVDLAGAVRRILEGRGVSHFDISGECTACRPDRFFSYRRDVTTGRQGAVAFRR